MMASFDTVKTLFMVGMGAVLFTMMAFYFNISMTVTAGFKQSMDPAYPYLQAIAMHGVNGRPFLEYLSAASERNVEIVDGVNVTAELSKFGEKFKLVSGESDKVLATEKPGLETASTVKTAFLAVPRGGYLVMTYEWP